MGDNAPKAAGSAVSRFGLTRRKVVGSLAAATVLMSRFSVVAASEPVRFGLTPVFLESDVKLLAELKEYLQSALKRPVQLIKKRTYQDITLMLLSGELDAAWICGFPFIRHRGQLELVAVPVYQGEPLYRSYVIVNEDFAAKSFNDLRGSIHAFSDPDSNSGFLVTRALLASIDERPESFFSKSFFTYGHRNVVRAVSSGLAHSGSVDGYVWDVLTETEPHLTQRTRVHRKSELLGFPPIACNRAAAKRLLTHEISIAFENMKNDPIGQSVLKRLYLDGFTLGHPSLFDGIAALYRLVRSQA